MKLPDPASASPDPCHDAYKAGTPVHEHPRTGKWWFFDEIWQDELGPYDTRDQAVLGCREYAMRLDGSGRDECDPPAACETHGRCTYHDEEAA